MENLDFSISSIDNPFSFFTEFENWKRFDEDKGYYTMNLIARLLSPSQELTDEEQKKEWQEACEDILRLNIGNYKKVQNPMTV